MINRDPCIQRGAELCGQQERGEKGLTWMVFMMSKAFMGDSIIARSYSACEQAKRKTFVSKHITTKIANREVPGNKEKGICFFLATIRGLFDVLSLRMHQ